MIADLASARLRIPALQAEPLPIAAIKPSPCTLACPAGINVKAYVSLVAEGRFVDALDTVRRHCPLPAVCGRICHHPCERACRRARYDDAVAIRALKRFVADGERHCPDPPVAPVRRREQIAVVGSGPAGLTAAHDLRQAGYRVKVLEAELQTGGMLRYGIADYRLPPDVLDHEVEVIRRAGVEILTGVHVGRDITFEELRSSGYAAVLVAIGAQRGRRLGLAGEEDTAEVEDALSFLRRVKSGARTRLEGRVVVVGGGSTAVEAARTAIRLGAQSVEVLYRRYREELLADDEEVHAAEAEGISFRFLVTPRRLSKRNGKLVALECVRIGLGEPDSSGRRRPIEIPGSEFAVETDRVLAAIGQEVVWPAALTETMSVPGVFAAGDAVTGPATVIEAIAGGHRSAEAIRNFIEGTDVHVRQPERRAAPEYEVPDAEPVHAARARLPLGTSRDFSEVERAFTAGEAVAEARRCLRCGPCGECRTCASTCNRRHVMVRAESGDAFLLRTPAGVALALGAERAAPGRLIDGGADTPVTVLPVRSRIQAERCRVCGRCVEICPFGALTLADPGARLDAALCRGCGLCSAVCPTGAAMQSALSPEWWSDRLDNVVGTRPADVLVLACQRRAGSLEKAFDDHGLHADVIRLRCVGQVDAGMLLELCRQPFRRVLVAGCLGDRCRFTSGAQRANEQFERAQGILRVLGLDSRRMVADWSPDRAGDRLEPAVARLAGGS